MPRPTLFLSDLHLGPERPEKLQLFRRLLRSQAPQADAVYILGDLFEQFWAGEDDRTPPNAEIIEELRRCTDAGANLHFLRGNRELMLTRAFEPLTGCELMPDECTVRLDGRTVLLMHGDRLCSRDWQYQAYRRFMQSPLTRRLFLGLPHAARLRLSHGLRPWMKQSMRSKPPEIMDADQPTIERFMRRHAVTTLVHGHTHRPGMHEFELDGRPARRMVLGDWYQGDSVLVHSEGDFQLMSVRELLEPTQEAGLKRK